MSEALVRQRVQDLANAFRAKDIDRIMSFYAPGVVSFDVGPPLRYAGAENKRRAWQEAFGAYAGPVDYEVRELDVAINDDLAIVHSLNHVKGTVASGHTSDVWLRWTACFRKLEGVWLIAHDHVSVPADLAHGQAALNLTP